MTLRRSSFPVAQVMLYLILALPSPAGEPKSDPNSWLGFGAGANKHLMVDLGLPVVHSGAAGWGIHFGYVGLNNQNSPEVSPSALQTGTIETNFDALQVGGYADWGRVFGAMGVERVEKATTSYGVSYTPNTHIAVPTAITANPTSFGAYLKVGYRVSRMLSIYAAAGTQTKVLGGIGVHF